MPRLHPLALVLVTLALPARAETAADVMTSIRSGEGDRPIALLTGSVTALVIMDRQLRDEGKARLFCPPGGTRVDPAMLNDMLTEADAWNMELPEALIAAFAKRFPCG